MQNLMLSVKTLAHQLRSLLAVRGTSDACARSAPSAEWADSAGAQLAAGRGGRR